MTFLWREILGGHEDPDGLVIARGIALFAHDGQLDQGGQPYFRHVERVAGRVSGDLLAYKVALLHDVLEDTPMTAAHLRRAGVDERVVQAVEALTHHRGEPEHSYLGRVRSNPLALKVKQADVADNTDPKRMALLPKATRERLRRKYRRYKEVLEG